MPQECLELFNKLVENEFLRVQLDPKDDLFKLKLGNTEMYGVLRLFHYKVLGLTGHVYTLYSGINMGPLRSTVQTGKGHV